MNQPTSRLDMLRLARRVVEQHTARQLALIDLWFGNEERRSTANAKERNASRHSRRG
ncbi:hypothetical protein ACIGXF_38485 [Streptomyces sp. NPDC053086]|uniref:hypothetical protein n=1 Tax=unclassified Streptomyces TaxID=2593676 RepID=UPI0037CF1A54